MSNNDIPGLGAYQSPDDYRDGYVMAAMGELAPEGTETALPATFYEELGKVLHQQKTPSCVAHSVATVVRLYHFYKTGQWIDFSPRFLDALAKTQDGLGVNDGAYPRMMMSLAAKYGCATTATVPNLTALSNAQYRDKKVLTPEAYAEALKYKIPGYVRVLSDAKSLRRATYFYGAVSVLYRIGCELWNPSWDASNVDPMRTPGTIVSGHQMTLNGWSTDKLNIIRNSWGTTWGTNGETHYDKDAWDNYTVEAWAVAEIPKNLKEYLANLPKPGDFHYTLTKDVKRGDVSADVKAMQIGLMILGFMAPVPPEDLGIYGPKTSVAVAAFQKASGISPQAPDSFGPKSRKAFNDRFAV